jgi:alpha-1,6-mannosyltransferase
MALTFCDVSTLYTDSAGGVRTYYRSKIEWFAAQSRHRYVLLHPGPERRRTRLAPSVEIVQVYGLPWPRSQGRYRVLIDYPAVRSSVAEVAPDVLEAGDPWVSGPVGLALRRSGLLNGVLASFYHSDPMETYLAPWASRDRWTRPVRRRVLQQSEAAFYRLQGLYDCTLVASATMGRLLTARGVGGVVHAPFGVSPLLFEAGYRRGARGVRHDGARVLYAGRLDPDKGIDLFIDALPWLLRRAECARVTVMGHGRHAATLAAIDDPRFNYIGFVADPERVAGVYAEHDILLAPGPYETFGLSVLEALATGLVVVGPDAGGTGELLRECESPLAFRAGDGRSFQDAIERALAADWDCLAAAGRALAARYGTWSQAVERQTRLYETLAASRRAR